ncbi:hypothetical protein KBD71_05210 [Candidatus Woesebacteria bacterium]|nr:hypothetical protein [Candidatus Woesebacteria bacterium]
MTSDATTKRQPVSLFDLIKDKAMGDTNKYVSQEFQDFGYRLAVELDDVDHKSLYMRMAKTIDRKILEAARTFVIDSNARSKARLFMWKVRTLKDEAKKKKSNP